MAGSSPRPYPSDLTDGQWALIEPLVPVTPAAAPSAGFPTIGQLLEWQKFSLHAGWVEQDRVRPEPIINPDIVGKNDLLNPDGNDPAFELWKIAQTRYMSTTAPSKETG